MCSLASSMRRNFVVSQVDPQNPMAYVVQAPRKFPRVATITTSSGWYECNIRVTSSHSEPSGRMVAARKLTTKSVVRLCWRRKSSKDMLLFFVYWFRPELTGRRCYEKVIFTFEPLRRDCSCRASHGADTVLSG